MARCMRWFLPVLVAGALAGLLIPLVRDDAEDLCQALEDPGVENKKTVGSVPPPGVPEPAGERPAKSEPAPVTGVEAARASGGPVPCVLRIRFRETGSGRDLPEVRVQLYREEKLHAEAVSAPDGRCGFEHLPAGVWEIHALPLVHVPMLKSLRLGPGEETDLGVDLDPGEQVQVRVEEEGTAMPLEGIQVRYWHARSGISRSGRTDACGEVRLPGLPRGAWTEGHLDVEGPGYYHLLTASGAAFTRTRAAEIRVRMVRAGCLEGRVLGAGGAPAPGVGVYLDCGETAWARLCPLIPDGQKEGVPVVEKLWTRTDPEGRFRLDGFPPRVAAALAFRARGRLPGVRKVTLEAGEERHGLVIRLQAGARLEGLVEDPCGRPVAGARVRVATSGRVRLVEKTGEGGAFRISGFRPGRYRVKASARGWIESVVHAVRIGRSGLPAPIRLVVRKAAPAIQGRVVDSEGHGLAGVEVAAHGVQRPGLLPGETFWPGTDVTDDAGRFCLAGLRPDWTYEVRVNAPDGSISPPRGPLSPGVRDLCIRVEAAGGLIGYVPPGLETPVFRVRVEQEGQPSRSMSRPYGTSPFSFSGLAPGRYRVEARGEDGRVVAAAREVGVRAGEVTGGVHLVQVAVPSLSGCVVDVAGRPLAGAAVSTFTGLHTGNPVRHETRTDAGGRFVLAGLGPCVCDLAVNGGGLGFTVCRNVRIPGRNLEVLFHPSVTIRVQVVSRADRGPVRGATVALMTRGSAAIRLRSDRDGQARFRTSPGHYAAVVAARGFESQGCRVSVLSAGREVFREFVLTGKIPEVSPVGARGSAAAGGDS